MKVGTYNDINRKRSAPTLARCACLCAHAPVRMTGFAAARICVRAARVQSMRFFESRIEILHMVIVETNID